MLLYRRGKFIVIKVSRGFIVYNTNKEWEKGHSHLRSYKAAKTAIHLVMKKRMPRSRGRYYLTTLQRIAEDDRYIERIEQIKNAERKPNYYNRGGRGVARIH